MISGELVRRRKDGILILIIPRWLISGWLISGWLTGPSIGYWSDWRNVVRSAPWTAKQWFAIQLSVVSFARPGRKDTNDKGEQDSKYTAY